MYLVISPYPHSFQQQHLLTKLCFLHKYILISVSYLKRLIPEWQLRTRAEKVWISAPKNILIIDLLLPYNMVQMMISKSFIS